MPLPRKVLLVAAVAAPKEGAATRTETSFIVVEVVASIIIMSVQHFLDVLKLAFDNF